MFVASANKPCKGGRTAPPTIIIINIDDTCEVCSFNPSIARVKTFDHIIELNNPIASKVQITKGELIERLKTIKQTLTKANIANERAVFPLPMNKPIKFKIMKSKNTQTFSKPKPSLPYFASKLSFAIRYCSYVTRLFKYSIILPSYSPLVCYTY